MFIEIYKTHKVQFLEALTDIVIKKVLIEKIMLELGIEGEYRF